MITLAGVSKTFLTMRGERVSAVESLTLEAEEGRITCIVGPTGSGKSTLLRLIAGLETPESGSLNIAQKSDPEEPVISYMTQEHALFPWLRVKDNIGLPFDLAGQEPGKRDRQVREIASALGLIEALERYPYELSGGMQRRTALGRLIASGARCWLMDEPFTGLDDRTAHQLQQLLLRLAAERGLTVLFVTHSIDEAVFLADRLIVLSAGPGRVVENMTVALDRPRERLSPQFGGIIEKVRCRLESVIDELPGE